MIYPEGIFTLTNFQSHKIIIEIDGLANSKDNIIEIENKNTNVKIEGYTYFQIHQELLEELERIECTFNRKSFY